MYIKNKINKIYRQTVLGYYLIHPFYMIYEQILKIVPDKKFIMFKYKRRMGYDLNLDNPLTLNEKINWLKLNDRSDLHTIAADKFMVREYIRDKIGSEYLIPLVYETKKPRDIIPEILPDYPIIIKTNHNSTGGIIVKDKNLINWNKARFDLKKLLRENYFYSSREWQYKNIEPRIVVEKLLMDEYGNIPYDYKLHCFNGKLIFTQVDLNRHTEHKRNLYDVNWEFIPCRWKYENGDDVKKPGNYNKMKKLAEKIAKDFIYVRVDFYSLGQFIYFGELTFHSESGGQKFDPETYDLHFGELLNIRPLEKQQS